MSRMQRNGIDVDGTDAADLGFAGFAHFTAMQVRNGAVRGLDVHLRRLRDASQELFARELDESLVRERMRHALVGAGQAVSMVVTVRCPEGEFTPADPDRGLDVVVRIDAPSDGPSGPLTLDVVGHERFLPHLKHVGEGAKTFHLWRAQAAGFDDAAFVDRTGRLTEATMWNLAFHDTRSGAVVWPMGPKLAGTAMQILQRRLASAGIAQHERPVRVDDVPGLATVVMNSWNPAVPVSRIGRHATAPTAEFRELLREVFDAEPFVEV